MAEEYRLKTIETTGPKPSPLYIKKPGISQVPYLHRIFLNPYLSIKPSTLMTQCDFFIYPYIGDLSHDHYQSFSRPLPIILTRDQMCSHGASSSFISYLHDTPSLISPSIHSYLTVHSFLSHRPFILISPSIHSYHTARSSLLHDPPIVTCLLDDLVR